MNNRLEMSNLQEMMRQSSQHFEQTISDLTKENKALRETIAALEQQVERLSGALVGNKSHFAKYVEVKTENLALQNKLETLAKTVPAKYTQQVLSEPPKSPRLPQLGASHGVSSNAQEKRKVPRVLGEESSVSSTAKPPLVPHLAVESPNRLPPSPRVSSNNGSSSARSVNSHHGSVGAVDTSTTLETISNRTGTVAQPFAPRQRDHRPSQRRSETSLGSGVAGNKLLI